MLTDSIVKVQHLINTLNPKKDRLLYRIINQDLIIIRNKLIWRLYQEEDTITHEGVLTTTGFPFSN